MKSSPHYSDQNNSPTDAILLNEYTLQESAKNDLLGKRRDKQEKKPRIWKTKVRSKLRRRIPPEIVSRPLHAVEKIASNGNEYADPGRKEKAKKNVFFWRPSQRTSYHYPAVSPSDP